jgi:hypothetical protein
MGVMYSRKITETLPTSLVWLIEVQESKALSSALNIDTVSTTLLTQLGDIISGVDQIMSDIEIPTGVLKGVAYIETTDQAGIVIQLQRKTDWEHVTVLACHKGTVPPVIEEVILHLSTLPSSMHMLPATTTMVVRVTATVG